MVGEKKMIVKRNKIKCEEGKRWVLISAHQEDGGIRKEKEEEIKKSHVAEPCLSSQIR